MSYLYCDGCRDGSVTTNQLVTKQNKQEVMAVQQVCRCCGKRYSVDCICMPVLAVAKNDTHKQGAKDSQLSMEDNKLPSVEHVEEEQTDITVGDDDFIFGRLQRELSH